VTDWPINNWVRAYDWQGRRQGDDPVVYRVDCWRVPRIRRLMGRLKRHVTQHVTHVTHVTEAKH